MVDQGRHTDIWSACLKIISEIIEPQMYVTWFKPIKAVSFENEKSELTIEVPSHFFREHLEEEFLDIIKKTLNRVVGSKARLLYLIKPVKEEAAMIYPASEGLAPVNKEVAINNYQPSNAPGPFVYPGISKIKINPRLVPTYCFANLIEGECNKMGITAGKSICEAPGKTAFNPLFLFGGSGLGKTHLSQAIGLKIKEKFPDLIVLYVTGNEFKTQYMSAVSLNNKLTDFLAFYMRIDVLIIDDIQDLMGQGSQNAFFNIFNHLHQSCKQLIFTSDRAPVDLQNFEERLLSRFKWGLSVELTRPDYPTRLAMLKSRSFREGISLDEEVLEFLAGKIKSNFRELEGVLISLIANATIMHKDITIELAESVVGNIVVDKKQSSLTIDKVQKIVCDYFNITRDTLLSKSRKRNIVQARQIAMYMSRSHVSNCSLAMIGSEIGGKDHATVLHACNTVTNLMSTDKGFKQYINDIEKLLLAYER